MLLTSPVLILLKLKLKKLQSDSGKRFSLYLESEGGGRGHLF